MERGLPNLPDGIVLEILTRLPVKSLLRFKSVSRPWLDLITDPQFIKSHLHQSMRYCIYHKLIIVPRRSNSVYFLDHQTPHPTVAATFSQSGITIVGSFNGVVLLEDIDDGLCLLNPSIRTYQNFSPPECSLSHDLDYSVPKFGLGYDSISDDFKVVAVVFSSSSRSVHVFSSKLSSWKCIGDFGYRSYLHGTGYVLNGAPHWFVNGHIVCFDFMKEKFKEVPLPIQEVKVGHFSFGILGGWLCLVDNRPESHSDVWVMKEYGVKESWIKLFVVPNAEGEFSSRYFNPLCFTKDEDVLMEFKSEELVIYDPKQKTYKRVWKSQACKFEVALHVESLLFSSFIKFP